MIVLRSVLVFLALGLAALHGGCAANPEMSLADTFETTDTGPVAGEDARQDFGPAASQVTGLDAPTDLTENAQEPEIARSGPTGVIDREDRDATLLYLRSLSQSVRGNSVRQLTTSPAELRRLQATHAQRALADIESGG